MSWNPFRDAKTRAEWREQLMREQGGRCALCGYRFPEPGGSDPTVYTGFAPTFDHIVPRAHGGEDSLDNLRLVHRPCNQIRGDGEGLKRLPPLPRALTVDESQRPRRVRTNAQGEAWCRNRDWKRVYPSLAAAWLGVLRTFLETGRITTPYHCGRSIYSFAVARYRITANPWAYDPYVHWVGSFKRRTPGCKMWHLTTLTAHVLGNPKNTSARP